MAASPSHGDVRPSVQGFRRSSSQFATVPTRSLSFHEQVGLDKSDAAAEVLYSHPGARIYKFAPPTDSIKSSSTAKLPHDTDYPVDTVETLPWRSRTETLQATGPLKIEKVRGSTNFLKCMDMMHAILRNSQCWCVDGQSKFVMRIGPFRYYRIELPSATEEDKKKVEELKETFGKVLRYERTPCPFIRAFQVDLPDDAITPRRKGTWKRRESSNATTPESEAPSLRRLKTPRTWSLRGTPPTSFPARFDQSLPNRPQTAETPSAKPDWASLNSRPSAGYDSSEDGTDSDHRDTGSDAHTEERESGQNSDNDDASENLTDLPGLTQLPTQEQTTSPEQASLAKDASVSKGEATPVDTVSPDVQTTISGKQTTEHDVHEKDRMESSSNKATAGLQDLISTEAEKGGATLSEDVDDVDVVQRTSNIENGTDPEDNKITKDGSEAGMKGAPVSAGEHEVDREQHHLPDQAESTTVLENEAETAECDDGNTSLSHEVLLEPEAVPQAGSEQQRLSDQDRITPAEPEEPVASYAEDVNPHQKERQSLSAETSKADSVDFDTRSADQQTEVKDEDDDALSIVSTDSFHTMASNNQLDDADSSLEERFEQNLRQMPQHRRGLSEMTITASSSTADEISGATPTAERAEPPLLIGSSVSDASWSDVQTPRVPMHESELRQRLRHRRSLSPMPPASTIAISSNDERSREISTAILQRAATIAVVKPLEAVIMVFHILARIASGATVNDLMSGELFRKPGARRTASGTLDKANPAKSRLTDTDDEDDFGIALPGRRKSSLRDDHSYTGSMRTVDDDAASFASLD